MIDFNAKESFFGLKELKGKKFGDWGLSKCSGYWCEIKGEASNSFNYWPELYPKLKDLPVVDAEVVFRLSPDMESNKESVKLPIKLLGTKKSESPFTEGEIGAIGFAPEGDFIQYLKKAYKWPKDQITIKINPLKVDNSPNGFSNKGGIYNRNDFNF